MRRPLLICLATFSVAAPALGLAACGGNGFDDDALIIYSGREEKLVGPLIERFEKETGIKAQVKYAGSPELAVTLLEEGPNSPADVFFSQDAGALGAVARENLLGRWPAGVLKKVPQRFRSGRDLWVGTSGRARVIGYDRRKLTATDLPDSVLDLTKREYRGRVAWAPTNASFQTFVTAMRKQLGAQRTREWLRAMKANDVQPYENNIAIRDAIAKGEVALGLLNHYYIAEAIAQEGPTYPVGIHVTKNGDVGALVNVAGVGRLRSSDQRQSAERFVRFLLTDASQRYLVDQLKEYSVINGFARPTGVPALSSIDSPDISLDDLDGLEETVQLLQDEGVL